MIQRVAVRKFEVAIPLKKNLQVVSRRLGRRGGVMVKALAVRVQALAGDIGLWFWARYFTLTVPLFTLVYK